jgi:hypothetical protein
MLAKSSGFSAAAVICLAPNWCANAADGPIHERYDHIHGLDTEIGWFLAKAIA